MLPQLIINCGSVYLQASLADTRLGSGLGETGQVLV